MPRRALVIGISACVLVAIAAWATPKVLRRMDMQGLRPVTVADGLEHPWAIAFLPDKEILVTERPGRMRIIRADGRLSEPLQGLPPVAAGDEGGLLDVIIAPDFERSRTIYWAYAEPAPGRAGDRSTAIARGVLSEGRIEAAQVIFRQAAKLPDGSHFGTRLAFGPDGYLYAGLGDRGQRPDAQRVDSAHGKILRMRTDGTPAPNNPYLNDARAIGQIWTLGHRNIQGLAFNPATGELWESEHGPQGGDELNVVVGGRNYGWPVITYGTEYTTSAPIGEGTAKEGMEQPVTWWGPTSIAPTGMTFLTSDRYPGWKGQVFIGTLQGKAIFRIKLDGHRVVEQQRLVTGLLERIRDIRQGPDGWLYVVTDSARGRVIRIER